MDINILFHIVYNIIFKSTKAIAKTVRILNVISNKVDRICASVISSAHK
jgi:hypothetical protein